MVGNCMQITPIHVNEIKISNKQLQIFFDMQAVWYKCFQGTLPIIFSLKRIGRLNLVSVIETSLRKPLCSLSQKCSQWCFCMQDMPYACTRVRPVIIAPIVKSINCLTCTLFSTFVTSKEINQTFFHAVESMINFVSFSCKFLQYSIQSNTKNQTNLYNIRRLSTSLQRAQATIS